MYYSKISTVILCFSFISNVVGQTFTDEQKLQGYAVDDENLTFIFDEGLYGVNPQEVFVTGEFRGWDASTSDPNWFLKENGNKWLLTIDNSDFEVVKPNTKFKYRIDDGEWLSPPEGAPNEKGGDLVFMKQEGFVGLRAELRSENLIWAEVSPERPLRPEAYQIVDTEGTVISVAGVLPNEATTALITPAQPLDKKRVYYLEVPELNLRTHCSFDGWFRETFSTKELGANIKNGATTIRIFSPRAEKVILYLYKGKDDQKAYLEKEMTQDSHGVWEVTIPEDLHGVYYDFTVHGAQEPGNHFYENNPVHITDPYARVSDDTWGKGRIWRATEPATPLQNGIPALEDVIAYEVHLQDFTDQLPAAIKKSGPYQSGYSARLTK